METKESSGGSPEIVILDRATYDLMAQSIQEHAVELDKHIRKINRLEAEISRLHDRIAALELEAENQKKLLSREVAIRREDSDRIDQIENNLPGWVKPYVDQGKEVFKRNSYMPMTWLNLSAALTTRKGKALTGSTKSKVKTALRDSGLFIFSVHPGTGNHLDYIIKYIGDKK